MTLSKKYPARLSLFIMMLTLFMACQAGQQNPQKQTVTKQGAAGAVKGDDQKTPAPLYDKLIVYYFHGNARCPTCFKLESFAKSEVESDFVDAIKQRKLEWKTVNVEDAGNEHFNDDYKLYTKAVIISMLKDGKQVSWKNLDRIWQLVHEEDTYRAYIRNEVSACLSGKCL
jgi:hypothetical protein